MPKMPTATSCDLGPSRSKASDRMRFHGSCCRGAAFARGGARATLRRFPGRGLTVGEVGALSDFDDIAVGIADVAARLAVLGDGLGDELGSSTFP
jgi:hypothetical protein